MKKQPIIKRMGSLLLAVLLALVFTAPAMAEEQQAQPSIKITQKDPSNGYAVTLEDLAGKGVKAFSVDLSITDGGNVTFENNFAWAIPGSDETTLTAKLSDDKKTLSLIATSTGLLKSGTSLEIGTLTVSGKPEDAFKIKPSQLVMVEHTRYQKDTYAEVAGQTGTLKVMDPQKMPVKTLTVDPYQMTLVLGKNVYGHFNATTEPEGASVDWKSDNPSVASVDNNGWVTARKAGTANITATAGDKTTTAGYKTRKCTVTVENYKLKEGALSISGLPVYGETLTAEVGNATGTLKWYRLEKENQPLDQDNLIKGADSRSYKIEDAQDIGRYIAAEFTGSGSYEGTVIAVVGPVAKGTQPAPELTVESTQNNQIVIKNIEGAEYSLDGKSWQDSNVFTQLTGDTFNVYIRMKETATRLASEARVVTVSVGKSNQPALVMQTPEPQTYDPAGNVFDLSATGGAGDGAVTYQLAGENIQNAAIEGNKLTVTAAGSYNVYAQKAMDDQYNEAVSETVTVTVHKAKSPATKAEFLRDAMELRIESSVKPEKVIWNGTELTEINKVEGQENGYGVKLPEAAEENKAVVKINDNYEDAVFILESKAEGPVTPADPEQENKLNEPEAKAPVLNGAGSPIGAANPYTGVITDPGSAAFVATGLLILLLAGLAAFKRRKYL